MNYNHTTKRSSGFENELVEKKLTQSYRNETDGSKKDGSVSNNDTSNKSQKEGPKNVNPLLILTKLWSQKHDTKNTINTKQSELDGNEDGSISPGHVELDNQNNIKSVFASSKPPFLKTRTSDVGTIIITPKKIVVRGNTDDISPNVVNRKISINKENANLEKDLDEKSFKKLRIEINPTEGATDPTEGTVNPTEETPKNEPHMNLLGSPTTKQRLSSALKTQGSNIQVQSARQMKTPRSKFQNSLNKNYFVGLADKDGLTAHLVKSNYAMPESSKIHFKKHFGELMGKNIQQIDLNNQNLELSEIMAKRGIVKSVNSNNDCKSVISKCQTYDFNNNDDNISRLSFAPNQPLNNLKLKMNGDQDNSDLDMDLTSKLMSRNHYDQDPIGDFNKMITGFKAVQVPNYKTAMKSYGNLQNGGGDLSVRDTYRSDDTQCESLWNIKDKRYSNQSIVSPTKNNYISKFTNSENVAEKRISSIFSPERQSSPSKTSEIRRDCPTKKINFDKEKISYAKSFKQINRDSEKRTDYHSKRCDIVEKLNEIQQMDAIPNPLGITSEDKSIVDKKGLLGMRTVAAGVMNKLGCGKHTFIEGVKEEANDLKKLETIKDEEKKRPSAKNLLGKSHNEHYLKTRTKGRRSSKGKSPSRNRLADSGHDDTNQMSHFDFVHETTIVEEIALENGSEKKKPLAQTESIHFGIKE